MECIYSLSICAIIGPPSEMILQAALHIFCIFILVQYEIQLCLQRHHIMIKAGLRFLPRRDRRSNSHNYAIPCLWPINGYMHSRPKLNTCYPRDESRQYVETILIPPIFILGWCLPVILMLFEYVVPLFKKGLPLSSM